MTNGVLLPIVASALLISLNDASLMGAAQPQAAGANAVMFPCVAVAIFLASVVLLKKMLGLVAGASDTIAHTAITGAFPVAAVCLLAVGACVWAARDGGTRYRRRAPRRSPSPMVRTVEISSCVATTSAAATVSSHPPC